VLTQILRARFEGLSLGSRFVFVRFIQLYGMDTTQALSVLELAKAVGVTDRVASAAIKQLIASGLLSRTAAERKRGRPFNSYSCASAVLAKKLDLGARDLQNALHEPLAANLLSGAARKKKGGLLTGNRLLLAVLLVYADEFGVVRGLGRRDISEMTGLKGTLIGPRIEKLLKDGFIRAYVPGSSSSGLFKPMKSAYYLNLPDLNLGHSLPQIALVQCSMFISYENEMLEAERISRCARRIGGGESLDEDKFPYLRHVAPIANWLASPAVKDFFPILQSRLDDCAAFILSKHWGEVQAMKTVVDPAVWWRICRAGRVKGGLLGREHKPQRKILMLMLVDAALCRAKAIQQGLAKDFSDLSFHSMRFAILPGARWQPAVEGHQTNLFPRVVALLASSPDQPPYSGCYVVENRPGQPTKQLYFSSERKLPVKKRCLYGLMTKATSSE
jgi:DNA-binding MarR family transcriptional regulator